MSEILIAEAKKLESMGDIANAIKLLENALKHEPNNLIMLLELANFCVENKQFEDAVRYFRRGYAFLKDDQDIKDALCFTLSQLGNEYQQKSQFLLSEACFEEIIQYEKNQWIYYYNLANAQTKLQKKTEAYQNYQKALSLNDQDADLWNNIGNIERELGYLDKAIASYSKAIHINPDLFHAYLHLTHQKQHMCDWNDVDDLFKKIRSIVYENPDALISPFAFISNPLSSSEDQLQCATRWTQNHFMDQAFKKIKRVRKNKIRIGYLSSDFKLHPLYFLIRDIIKYHDRDLFDIYAYDATPSENTLERKTLIDLFDFHRNIFSIDDENAAAIIDKDDIDILIDLTGYTNNSRAFIAPQLPHTITMNWLGYPGTMGFTQEKSLYDYILADDFIIPKEDEKYYAESVLKLPFAYQPNIENRSHISQKTRKDYGIPDDAFVYCAFNQSFKITEFIFNVWLILLKRHPKSILWLTYSNRWATENLKKYAETHGIDSQRILFAMREPNKDHIARHALADIYLDTLPYNAHTSASDALSMHLPIVTLKGKTFPSRVAGSLLHSLGLDELITEDAESYINCVTHLTEDSEYRATIIEKLKKAKEKSPIFQPKLFTKALEAIYLRII